MECVGTVVPYTGGCIMQSYVLKVKLNVNSTTYYYFLAIKLTRSVFAISGRHVNGALGYAPQNRNT